MFTRILKQKNKNGTTREYLCVVENYRENGKRKQRMIANLGRFGTEITAKEIDQIAESLVKHGNKIELVNILKDLKSKASKAYGEIEIFRKAFKDMQIEELLREKLVKTEKQVDYVEAIFMAVSLTP